MKRKQIQEAKSANIILASKRKEKQYQCVLKGKQKKNTMPVAKQSQTTVTLKVKWVGLQRARKSYWNKQPSLTDFCNEKKSEQARGVLNKSSQAIYRASSSTKSCSRN